MIVCFQSTQIVESSVGSLTLEIHFKLGTSDKWGISQLSLVAGSFLCKFASGGVLRPKFRDTHR